MAKKSTEPACRVCGREPVGKWEDEPGWVRVDPMPMDFSVAHHYYLCPDCITGKIPEREAKPTEPEGEIVGEGEEQDGWWCEECEEFFEDEPESPLYECSSCGEYFTRGGSSDGDSNRCPSCNKFGAKLYDFGCDSCQSAEAVPVTQKTIYVARVAKAQKR